MTHRTHVLVPNAGVRVGMRITCCSMTSCVRSVDISVTLLHSGERRLFQSRAVPKVVVVYAQAVATRPRPTTT